MAGRKAGFTLLGVRSSQEGGQLASYRRGVSWQVGRGVSWRVRRGVSWRVRRGVSWRVRRGVSWRVGGGQLATVATVGGTGTANL
jgi:hypothetical protein